jgi:hypothetical protein
MSGEIYDLSGDPSEGIVCIETVLDENCSRKRRQLGGSALGDIDRQDIALETDQFGYTDPEVEAWRANNARLVAERALAAARRAS